MFCLSALLFSLSIVFWLSVCLARLLPGGAAEGDGGDATARGPANGMSVACVSVCVCVCMCVCVMRWNVVTAGSRVGCAAAGAAIPFGSYDSRVHIHRRAARERERERGGRGAGRCVTRLAAGSGRCRRRRR